MTIPASPSADLPVPGAPPGLEVARRDRQDKARLRCPGPPLGTGLPSGSGGRIPGGSRVAPSHRPRFGSADDRPGQPQCVPNSMLASFLSGDAMPGLSLVRARLLTYELLARVRGDRRGFSQLRSAITYGYLRIWLWLPSRRPGRCPSGSPPLIAHLVAPGLGWLGGPCGSSRPRCAGM